VVEEAALPQTVHRSTEIDKLALALSKAQAKITAVVAAETAKVVTKKGANYQYKYAHLSAVLEVCRVPLSENGLAVVQAPQAGGGVVVVTTMILHSSGQFISSDLALRPAEYTPQAIGSAITYARRYALSAMVGVAPEDDDGKAAQPKTTESAARKPKESLPPADPAVARKKLSTAPDLATLEKWDAAVPLKFAGNKVALAELAAAANIRFMALLNEEANTMTREACEHWQTWAGSRGYDPADVDDMTSPIRMRLEELDGQQAGAPVA